MFSLNVPVPPAVSALADDLAPDLVPFVPRRERTLVLKRLGDLADHATAERRAREALSGAPAVEARVASVGVFEAPPNGPGPVVYLRVEGRGLRRLHERLCDALSPVPELEGDDYVPHVTLARGVAADTPFAEARALERARDLDGRSVGPATWTVDELAFYDARHGEAVGRVTLPA